MTKQRSFPIPKDENQNLLSGFIFPVESLLIPKD